MNNKNPPLSIQDAKAREAASRSSRSFALNVDKDGFGDHGKNIGLAEHAAHVTTLTKDQINRLWYKTHWSHFFIAINLSNNQPLIPDFTRRLLAFLEVFVFPFFPRNHVVVSIFSNGNKDQTTERIESAMRKRLESLGIGLRIVSNGTCCSVLPGDDFGDAVENEDEEQEQEEGGTSSFFIRRPKEVDRIEWMAGIRNAALWPLLQRGPKGAFLPPKKTNEERKKRASLFDTGRGFSPPTVPPTANANVAVIFFNDIFFFPHDVFRLLTTKAGDFDMVCGLDYYYTFYDTWVTRDLSGRRFSAYPPFAPDFRTQAAFRAGKPAQVKCCWNGMVVIRGSSFEKTLAMKREPDAVPRLGGVAELAFDSDATHKHTKEHQRFVAFRYNTTPTRCYSSECQLFCEDLHAHNRHKIFINPLVKVAYEPYFFNLHHFSWLCTSGFLFSIAELARIWAWPAVVGSDAAAAKPAHADTQGMDCVDPLETVNYTPADFGLYLVVAVVLCWIAVRCLATRGGANRRREGTSPTKRSNGNGFCPPSTSSGGMTTRKKAFVVFLLLLVVLFVLRERSNAMLDETLKE